MVAKNLKKQHETVRMKWRLKVPVRLFAYDRLSGWLTCLTIGILVAAQLSAVHAQDNPAAPIETPSRIEQTTPILAKLRVEPASLPPATLFENLGLRGGLVCGSGASASSVATRPTTQCGALIGLGYLETEVGVMGPQANRSLASGYLSENLWIPMRPKSRHGSLIAVGGYTRMFETGHAVDLGLAYARPIGRPGDMRYLQLEVRDYMAFANPNQHNVLFRVVWLFGAGGEE